MTDSNQDPVELIVGQLLTAFGQGTNALRVSRESIAFLRDRYLPVVAGDLKDQWEKEAVEILEKLRAMGRLAAQYATDRGSTTIATQDTEQAVHQVEDAADTPWCPKD